MENENKMNNVFWSAVVDHINYKREAKLDKALQQWAQVEYGSDWKYAYNHMKDFGKKPSTTEFYHHKRGTFPKKFVNYLHQ
jgi:hypothetical protein